MVEHDWLILIFYDSLCCMLSEMGFLGVVWYRISACCSGWLYMSFWFAFHQPMLLYFSILNLHGQDVHHVTQQKIYWTSSDKALSNLYTHSSMWMTLELSWLCFFGWIIEEILSYWLLCICYEFSHFQFPASCHKIRCSSSNSRPEFISLKILKDSEERPEVAVAQKKWKRLSSLTSISVTFASFVEEDKNLRDIAKVDTSVIFPNALSTEQVYWPPFIPQFPPRTPVPYNYANIHGSVPQLFGYFADNHWQNGLLANIFRNSHFQVAAAENVMESFDDRKNKMQIDTPAVIHKWVILDGALNPDWVECMNTLLDDGKKLSLSNGENISLQGSDVIHFPPHPSWETNSYQNSMASICG